MLVRHGNTQEQAANKKAACVTCKRPSKEARMEREQRSDRFTAIEDRFAGYTVYDQDYEKIGNVDDLFVDENDQPEYIGVKMGLLGMRSTLIPWELVEVRETDSTLIV